MAEIVRILETALEYQANPHSIKDVDIRALRLPDPSKVMRLVYTNSGDRLLALTSSGIHKLWKWQGIDPNPYGESNASIVPQLWQPISGPLMCNDVSESKPAEESAACVAISKNDSYVISASGGKVSLFNMMTFKVMVTFMPPPPAATYLAFHPHDNNVIAMGMEDSTIQIYNVRVDKVIATLKGHQKQITGLSFSWIPVVLVSSGADAQICIWNTDTWEKIKSRCLESPPGYPSPIVGETKVQLHNNHRHVLVVHESQIAIYDDQLEFLRWWSPRESLSAPISSVVYSCDGLLVFTGFLDGAVGVFDADSLRLRCRIAPSAYNISSSISSKSNVYPVDIAAHPLYVDQFAVGLSDGSVQVIEPAAGETTWGGVSKPHQDGSSALFNSSNSGLNSDPQSIEDLDLSVLTIVDGADKTSEIVDSSQLRAVRLPDPSKVTRLVYTNSGDHLLALTSSAIHKLWKWQRIDRNPYGKSTASIVPQLWQPKNGALMCNDVSKSKPAKESAACIALSKNDSYVISASGGKVSLFNMRSFKVMATFMPPPLAATYLAFHPQDNNIVAIGMEDSTIQIYNVRVDEVKIKLKGHQKQITGLAFSQTLNALVSSGADAQLCIWNINGWEKIKSRSIQSPAGHPSSLVGETKVQFHNDQRHVLVVHESQIAIYDYQLECLRLWSPRESLSAPISSAVYSCDGSLVFTGFLDGAVGVFDADSLRFRCRIAPSAYISSSNSSSNSTAYPVVIAAHPSDPDQFALGMSDGSVHVIEPADADPKWGGSAPQENGTVASSNPSNSAMIE